jgi:hypothetical protein
MLDLKQYEEAVSSPGKFEGEPIYTPYFWEQTLDGATPETDHLCEEEHEEECENYSYFYPLEILPSEKDIFPELKEYAVIEIWEDSNGFVYHNLVKGGDIQ